MNPSPVSSASNVYSTPMQSVQSYDATSSTSIPGMEPSADSSTVLPVPVTTVAASGSAVSESGSNSQSFPTESQLQQTLNEQGNQSTPSNVNAVPTTMSGNTYPVQMQQPSNAPSVSYCAYPQTTTTGYAPQQYASQQSQYMPPQSQYVQQQPQYVQQQPQYVSQQQYVPPQPQYMPQQQLPQYMPQQPTYPTSQHLKVRFLSSIHF